MSNDLLNNHPPAGAQPGFLSPDDLFAGPEEAGPKPAAPEIEVAPESFLSPDALFAAPTSEPIQPERRSSVQTPAPVKPKKRGAGKKIGSLLFNILFYVLILAVLAGAAAFAFSNYTQRSVFGYRIYTILSDTMKPAADGSSPAGGFVKGDAVIVHLTDPETIRVGDIITYTPDPSNPAATLTHRVVQVLDQLNGDQGLFFVTRGDASQNPDPPTAATAVIGIKIFTIPYLGAVMGFIRDHLPLSLIAVLATFGLIILLRYYFSDRGKSAPKKPKAQKAPREKKRPGEELWP